MDLATIINYCILSFDTNNIMSQTLANSENLAIHGYHDKHKNSYSLMNSTLPLLIDEKYSPFLITKGFHYSISTQSIKDLLQSYKIQSKYQRRKQLFSNFLVLPGFIFALMYIANSLELLDQIPILYTISQSWIADFTFWISMFGVMILWHEYFRKRTHPIKFSKTERFSHKEKTNIEITGIKFEKYKRLQASHFLSQETKEYLFKSSKNKSINTYTLLSILLKDSNVKQIIKRAGLNFSKQFFKQQNISKETFPKYPIESLRSLTIYALEEAIITDYENIQPIHLFLSMARIYPTLRKFIATNDNTIEILREATNFELHKQIKYGFFDKFDIQKTYYASGGIGHKWIYIFSEKSKQYLEDLTVSLAYKKEVFGIARKETIQKITSIIERKENNNVLLIGPQGVGKSSIVKAIAQQINWGKLPKSFRGKRVIKIGSDFIVNTSPKVPAKYFSQILKTLEKRTNNIYYIDNLISIITPRKNRKTLNETQKMLIEFIKAVKSPIISTVNYSEYQNNFKTEKEVNKSFNPIEIPNISKADTLSILEQKVSTLEETFGIQITIPSLIVIIDLTYQQQSQQFNKVIGPKTAVERLKQAVSLAFNNNIKTFDSQAAIKYAQQQNTNQFINDKSKSTDNENFKPNTSKFISITKATSNIQLAEKIKTRIVGRNQEIDQISKLLHYSQNHSKNLNFHKILLGGPSGSGKTYLAKTFAKELIGKSPIIIIDLEKYQYVSDLQKLLHRYSIQIKNTGNYIITGVIILDKIESLNPSTYEFIKELLKKGHIPGQYRRRYIFKDCLLFATTQIGSEYLINTTGKPESLIAENKQRALLSIRAKLQQELIDEFDYISMLNQYSVIELAEIVEIELEAFAQVFLENDFYLTWEAAIPQIIANKIQNSKIKLTGLKQIIHDIANTSILEKAHKEEISNSKSKEIKIISNSLNKYFISRLK